MEAAVQKALPTIKAFKDVDEPTIDYISSMVAEEKAIKSAAQLTTLLTDLLVSYDVIQKESEAKKICEELFDKLVKAGVCKAPVVAPKPTAAAAAPTAAAVTPSASPSSSSSSTLLTLTPPTHSLIAPQGHRWIVATEKLRARMQVGMEVLGRWKKDLKWYPCRIEKINEDGSFVIRVPEYTSEQQTVELAYIKMLEKISYLSADIEAELRDGGWKIGSNQADRLSEWDGATENAASAFENGGAFEVKKLAQAIVIGEFGITAAERADAALHASLIAEKIASKKIFSKKELREKKKAELEVKKEAARVKALEQKKFEALKRYLAADKNGKPTDVEIHGVQLSTPDGSQELLNGATLKFVTGRRYGLIGRNGVGKTSLMRAISGYELPDFPVHLRVVHVEQEVQGDEMSVIESVLAADIERSMLLEEERKLMRSLKSEEVAAAKAQADQKEASEKSAREKLKSERQRKMIEEEAESAKRLGASVDQMLDNMRELDAELDELDDGADLPDDYSIEPASSTDAGSDDEEADADLARMEAEAKAAEEEEDDDDDDDGEERKSGGSKSKSKRGKVNKTARDAARRKEREVQLPQTLIVDPTTRLTQIYARMNEIDTWGAEARARQILTGLQFSVARQQGKTRDLSGGWRQRVSLAQALFVNPDILLLDEPTNHLDFPAVLWLEEYLRKYEKTLIIVSHDRSFLNNVITDTIHYYQKQLNYYRGNYDMFEKVRADKMKQMKREFDAQKAKRAHIQSFIDKFRCSASRAALVQSRIKALAKMDALIDVVEEHQTTFSFPEPDRIDGPILQCTNLKFGYHYNKILLDKVTVNVDMDSRIGVIGANGTGKTTLINLLVGKLTPITGSVSRNGSARIAVFAQHHVDGLDLRLSAVDFLCSIFPGNNAQIFRRHLGCFGITGDLATNPMRNLSGGQKSRVAFSVVTWKKPHVIILDEPTNHLDLETIDALISAIQNFGGGCLFVSHDQNFLRSVGNEYWGVSNGTVKRFDTFEATKKFSYAASNV